ncbi:leucine-rich repeat-containing protein 57-like [Penaeus japonicus]|uniref:leucine-rich repeat-containing protein 57-like n=1 Tax=Penaeus japonicus TaxID=27405 RepID=UPI001C70B6CF|nr:leucine-rich repeat-containing protein 57-like [Penaeus japonicus]
MKWATRRLQSLFLFFFFSGPRSGGAQECPCTWHESEESWTCLGAVAEVPTQCWPLHERIRKVVLDANIREIKDDDFAHENLQGLIHLEMRRLQTVARGALRPLTKLVYLDVAGGSLQELPDVSKMTDLLALLAHSNQLTGAPSLTHMQVLDVVELHGNRISSVPDDFLPNSAHLIDLRLQQNAVDKLNASSIVTAPAESRMTFDPLSSILATVDEKDLLLEKEFEVNIDIESIIEIIEDPPNPYREW